MPAPKVPTIKGVTSKPRGGVEHLKPHQFKPGQSGNPGGRPKGLSAAYKLRLDEVEPKTGKTYAELIAIAVTAEAMKGKIEAAKELRQATEGDTLNLPTRPKSAEELTDDELAAIAAGDASGSGDGAAETPPRA